MDTRSAEMFLRTAVYLLKYFISTGRVITPTAIRVETKAAIWAYPAPSLRRAAPRGKVTKLGIRVTDPAIRATAIPNGPDSAPISLEIVSGLRIAREIPTNIIIERTSGRRDEKDFQALRIAIFVFFRSLKKETTKKIKARA